MRGAHYISNSTGFNDFVVGVDNVLRLQG